MSSKNITFFKKIPSIFETPVKSILFIEVFIHLNKFYSLAKPHQINAA